MKQRPALELGAIRAEHDAVRGAPDRGLGDVAECQLAAARRDDPQIAPGLRTALRQGVERGVESGARCRLGGPQAGDVTRCDAAQLPCRGEEYQAAALDQLTRLLARRRRALGRSSTLPVSCGALTAL